MGIASFLPRVTATFKSRLASEIARRSEAAVWQRVRQQIGRMSLPEARGYIRARAASVLLIEAHPVLSKSSVGHRHRPEIMELAVQNLTHSVVARLLREERQNGLRRAA